MIDVILECPLGIRAQLDRSVACGCLLEQLPEPPTKACSYNKTELNTNSTMTTKKNTIPSTKRTSSAATRAERPPIRYLGLDVAKRTLAGHLGGVSFSVANDPSGHRELCTRSTAHSMARGPQIHVICEATGGYERPVVRALREAGVAVSVLHPARARKLAEGLGFMAKTDALDAAALAAIGALLEPAPTPAPDPAVEQLAAFVARREQLTELIRREKHHRETTSDPGLLKDIAQSLAALEKRHAKLEAHIGRHLAAQPLLAAKSARLQQAPGVGPVAAATLLALLPELGHGHRNRIASLAGLAPRNRDSGASSGQRHVRGGRPKVRRILYLCALSAARHHPALKDFYTRLRNAGKSPKVALVAVARKLLIRLHSALKNPNFALA